MPVKAGSFTIAARKRSQSKKWSNMMMRWLLAIALTVGGWQVLTSGYLLAKAYLAQWLIADAWDLTLQDGQTHRPWSWADTHPVAKLMIPRLNKSSYVLADANGRNLAFGPAHVLGSGMPGEARTTVFSGHNDSHFSYLSKVAVGDLIQVETTQGEFEYHIVEMKVVDSDQRALVISGEDQLILTTCYPFNSLTTGGSLRFHVIAERQ